MFVMKCKDGSLDESQKIYDDLRQRTDDVVVHTAMMQALATNECFKKALDIFESSVDRSKMSHVTAALALNLSSEVKDFDKGYALFEEAKKKGLLKDHKCPTVPLL